MATPYSDIYSKFQSLITDTDFASLTQLQVEDIFEKFLDRSAQLDFVNYCDSDLTDFDATLKQFTEDLSQQEQWILAYGMLLSYIDEKLVYNRLMYSAISGGDFTENSHAPQLKNLTELRAIKKEEFDRYKIEYTYRNFEGFY